MKVSSTYIHGINPAEQNRLTILNSLLNDRCIEKIPIHSGARILDVGSGLGLMTAAFAEKAGANSYVLGIERSEAQLQKAQSIQTPGLHFRKGDAFQLPLTPEEEGTFDLVFARFILEHLPEPQRAIKEMFRALKPGGTIVLADDDHEAMILYPEPAGFKMLWSAYIDSYLEIGNDPFIGRKLPRLLIDNGFINVRNDVAFFGDVAGSPTFQAYILNLSEVIATARDVMFENNLIESDDFESALNNLKSWSNIDHATAFYPLCMAFGKKPE